MPVSGNPSPFAWMRAFATMLTVRNQNRRTGRAEQLRRQLSLLLLFPAVLIGLTVADLNAQGDPGADIRFRLRTNVELVLVPVTVKDSAGKLVTGLERADFRLWENGDEQQIRYFSIDPFPLSAVILLDRGLRPPFEDSLEDTLAVLSHAFAPDDEFAFYVFDAYPREVLNFTRDPAELRQAIHRVFQQAKESNTPPPARDAPGGPFTSGPRINTVPVGPAPPPTTAGDSARAVKCIHDALFEAGLALRTRERGRRRVIFILSDGTNSRLNVHGFDETRDLLLAEEVSVYALGVGNARFALGTTVLSDYASATGGDFYAPRDRDGLARAFLRVTEQARHQYTLVYAARPAPAGREYRQIKVKVERAGVKVRARQGYFAGVPEH